MDALGCVLVDLRIDGLSGDAARAHVAALLERLGPELPLDVRWPGPPPPGPLGARARFAHAAGARALAGAAARATAAGGPLLVLLGTVLPDVAAVEALLAGFGCDPLVGSTQPRFSAGPGAALWSLPQAGAPGHLVPRRALPLLAERYLLPERLAACLAVRREVVAGFQADPDAPEDLADALLAELQRARRRGFRTLVLNRVVVASGAPHEALYPAAAGAAAAHAPDAKEAEALLAGSAHLRFEAVAAQARPADDGAGLPVLLDCRGVPPFHNGTSQAALHLLTGIAAEAPGWQIDVLLRAEAVAFHGLRELPGRTRLVTALPARSYAAAVRLDQPWHLSTVIELHRRACTLSFNMLDTIRWDVIGDRARDADRAWRVVAGHSDGILYNSAFTRERFGFRFPVAAGVLETVTHHAIDPPAAAANAPEADHVLVFGNDLEHKAVATTVELLRRGFPYQEICALGSTLPEGPHLRVLRSGTLPEPELQRLLATARAVVFPSWYEGFGLPAAEALALGRTVVVRASPLWREVAALSRGTGRLVEFVAPHELVEQVGRILAGHPAPGLPLGGALAPPAPTWRDCARRVVEHVERLVAGFDGRRWYAREEVLALAEA